MGLVPLKTETLKCTLSSLSLSPPPLSPALPFSIYLYLSNPGKELSPETELAYLQVMTTYFSVT